MGRPPARVELIPRLIGEAIEGGRRRSLLRDVEHFQKALGLQSPGYVRRTEFDAAAVQGPSAPMGITPTPSGR